LKHLINECLRLVFAINYVAHQNVAVSMKNFRVPIALLFINNYLNYCQIIAAVEKIECVRAYVRVHACTYVLNMKFLKIIKGTNMH